MGCKESKRKSSNNTTEGNTADQTNSSPPEGIDVKNIIISTERTGQVESSQETGSPQADSMDGKNGKPNLKRKSNDKKDGQSKKEKRKNDAKNEKAQTESAEQTMMSDRNNKVESSKSTTEKSTANANDQTEAFKQNSVPRVEQPREMQTNQVQRNNNVNTVEAVKQPEQKTLLGVKENSDKQNNIIKEENAEEKEIERNIQGNTSRTDTDGHSTRKSGYSASDQRAEENREKQFDGKGQENTIGQANDKGQEPETKEKQDDDRQNEDNAADEIRGVVAVQSESSKDLQKEIKTLKKAVQEKEEMLKKLKGDHEEKARQHEKNAAYEKDEMLKKQKELEDDNEEKTKKIKELEDEITETQARAVKTITSKSDYKSSKNSEEIAKLKRQITDLTTEKEKTHQETLNIQSKIEKEKDVAVAKKVKEIRNLENEKEELLLRLSEMAGRRLTDNNPNIADLSDFNRPTKLAEKYTELYDNEWTDAYSYLETLDAYKGSETEVIAALMLMLTTAYKISLGTAEKQLEALRKNLNDFHGNVPKHDQQVKDILKQLKDQRKRVVQPSQDLTEKYRKQIEQAFPKLDSSKFESGALKPYLRKCLQLCWLMVIQDPPVHLECEGTKKADKFDKNKFKEYTKAGPFIKYSVWPAVFLEKDGPLLCKGVVQCTRQFSGSFHATAGKTVIEVKSKSSSVRISGEQTLTMIPAKVATSDNANTGRTSVTEKGRSEKINSQTAKYTGNTDVQIQERKTYFTEKL